MENTNLRTLDNTELQMIAGGNLEAPMPHSYYMNRYINRFDALWQRNDALTSDRHTELGSKHSIAS